MAMFPTQAIECLRALEMDGVANLSEQDAQLLSKGPLGQLLMRASCQPKGAAAANDAPNALVQLQGSLLLQQRQIAALKAEASQLSSRAILCSTYADRLCRLQLVFEQYGRSLQQLLCRFGLGPRPEQAGDSGELANYLQSSESALRRALQAGPADAGQLLQQCAAAAPSCPLSAAAVLPVVQAGLAEDVRALAALVGAGGTVQQQQQEPVEGLLDTLRERHWHEFSDGEQLRQEQCELSQQLQQAYDAVVAREPAEGAAALRFKQLAAQQAGLHAALRLLDQLQQELRGQQRGAAAQQEEAQAALKTLAQLQSKEEELDRSLGLLCMADAAFMRQWRDSTWQAQGFISDRILAARTPLQQLGTQLVGVMQQELQAFQAMPPPSCAQAAPSNAENAALRLDPVAHLKTADHSAVVLSAAIKELQELRPVHGAWEALVASSARQLEELQAEAAKLRQEVAEVDSAGAQGVHELLDKSCSAAEAGMAAVQGVRTAMADWWTLPGFKAAPWIKYEGKSAVEWLRVLSEQQELLNTRQAFKDHSNRKR